MDKCTDQDSHFSCSTQLCIPGNLSRVSASMGKSDISKYIHLTDEHFATRVLFKNPIVAHLIKEDRTGMFITLFTTADHEDDQSSPHPQDYLLMLRYLRLPLCKIFLQILYAFLIHPMRVT